MESVHLRLFFLPHISLNLCILSNQRRLSYFGEKIHFNKKKMFQIGFIEEYLNHTYIVALLKK